MTKYRKKTIEVAAIQFTSSGMNEEMKNFAPSKIDGPIRSPDENLYLAVHTPKGLIKAYIGYWIIKDADDLLSCCPPDIFAVTYEPVDEKPDVPIPAGPIDHESPTWINAELPLKRKI